MELQEIEKEMAFYERKLKEVRAKFFENMWKNKKREIKVIDQVITDRWSMYHGDCVPVLEGIPSNSIHYSLFSPPFSSLFVYSNTIRDMGNSTDDEFYEHFDFFIPSLYRVMMPGRLVSVHCTLLPMTISIDGVIGVKDFRGNLIRIFQKCGFIFHSEVSIWKDPLVQATRTKMLSLAHKQVVKDSARSGMSFLDYIITMRKPGENPEPISRGRGFEEYIGEEPIEEGREKHDDPAKNRYSQRVWQRYASPIWLDIRQTNTLNIQQAREKDDERHICPLQLDVIARCLELWTNKGDIVLSPFAGIGSEGYEAVRMGRKFIGIELKKSYYDISVKNLKSVAASPKGFGLI